MVESKRFGWRLGGGTELWGRRGYCQSVGLSGVDESERKPGRSTVRGKRWC